MSTPRRTRSSGSPTKRVAAPIACVAFLAALAAAQYALDAGLGGNRVNQPTQHVTVSSPVYTVNRNTGEMAYNRANAFNDSTYKIHQRYGLDRTEYFDAGSRGVSATSRSVSSVPQTGAGTQRAGGAAMHIPGVPKPSGGRHAGAAALAAPSYSSLSYGAPPKAGASYGGGGRAHSSGNVSGLSAPTYRVSGGGGGGGGRRK